MKPGIYQLKAEEYHKDPCDLPSLSNSMANIILNKTMAHARLAHPRLNPDYQDRESGSRMDIGSAAHSVFLEGIDIVEVCHFDDWRKKDAQQQRDDARHAGKTPLLFAQYDCVMKMAEAAHASVKKIGLKMQTGKPELVMIWQEDDTHCRARPDWLADDHSFILDYKTTDLYNPAAWMRAMIGNGYDTQAHFYPRGVNALSGAKADFIFMVQEVKAPYPCYFVRPSQTMLEIGRIKIERALLLWKGSMRSGHWSGYSSDILEAEVTPWQLAEAENMAAEMEIPDGKLGNFDLDAPGAKEGFFYGKVPEKGNRK